MFLLEFFQRIVQTLFVENVSSPWVTEVQLAYDIFRSLLLIVWTEGPSVFLDDVFTLKTEQQLLVWVQEQANQNIKVTKFSEDADAIKFILYFSLTLEVELNFSIL